MNKSIIIAAPKSNAGKTTVTLGLLRLLKRNGINVQPFKSGPDYIDPKFHELACGKRGVNLDLFMMGKSEIERSLEHYGNEFNCIEGVMGLFDGAQKAKGSTAELAKELNVPVILVVDAKAVAYSVAPLIKGFIDFDSNVTIAGVIFNKVGSDRHYQLLKEACDDIDVCSFGYLGNIPKVEIPSRHLGLNIADIEQYSSAIDLIADEVDKNVDWQQLIQLVSKSEKREEVVVSKKEGKLRIAIAQDEAFNFIYPQSIDVFESLGEVTFFSPLKDEVLPEADFVYLPGGYPECYLTELSANESMLQSIKNYTSNNGAVFAECGGMMYLGQSIVSREGEVFDMVGHFGFSTSMEKSKLNLGYRTITIDDKVFKGHEFHYSTLIEEEGIEHVGSLKSAREVTVNTKIYKQQNVLASYVHLYFGTEETLRSLMLNVRIMLNDEL